MRVTWSPAEELGALTHAGTRKLLAGVARFADAVKRYMQCFNCMRCQLRA